MSYRVPDLCPERFSPGLHAALHDGGFTLTEVRAESVKNDGVGNDAAMEQGRQALGGAPLPRLACHHSYYGTDCSPTSSLSERVCVGCREPAFGLGIL